MRTFHASQVVTEHDVVLDLKTCKKVDGFGTFPGRVEHFGIFWWRPLTTNYSFGTLSKYFFDRSKVFYIVIDQRNALVAFLLRDYDARGSPEST